MPFPIPASRYLRSGFGRIRLLEEQFSFTCSGKSINILLSLEILICIAVR